MSDNPTKATGKKAVIAIACAAILVIGGYFLVRAFAPASNGMPSNNAGMTMSETPLPASSVEEDKPIDVPVMFGDGALSTETTLSQVMEMLGSESFCIGYFDFAMTGGDGADDLGEEHGIDYLSFCQVQPDEETYITVRDDSLVISFKVVNTADSPMKLGDLPIYSFETSRFTGDVSEQGDLLSSKVSVMDVHIGDDATRIIEGLGEPVDITSDPYSDDENGLLMMFFAQGRPLSVYADGNYIARAFSIGSHTESTLEEMESVPEDADAWRQSRISPRKDWWENSGISLENREIALGETTLSKFADGLSGSFDHELDEEIDPDDFELSTAYSGDSFKAILQLSAPSGEKTSYGASVITGISFQMEDEDAIPESPVLMIGDFSCVDSPSALVEGLGRPTVRSGNTYRYQRADGEQGVSSMSLFFRNGHLVSVTIE